MRFLPSLVCVLAWSVGAGSFSVRSAPATSLGRGVRASPLPRLVTAGRAHPGAAARAAQWPAPPSLRLTNRDAPESDRRPRFGRGLRRRLGQLRQFLCNLRLRRPSLSRPFLCVVAAAMLWLGAASLDTSPALASTTAAAAAPPATATTRTVTGAGSAAAKPSALAPAPLERMLERTSPSVDQIVDRYVRDHMFDDDAYDPVESLYREALDDAGGAGAHPRALREIAGEALAAGTAPAEAGGALSQRALMNRVDGILSALAGIGLSESRALQALAVLVTFGSVATLVIGFAAISQISKANLRRIFKERYGDDFTLDATIAEDKGVELPDDDDDDEYDDDEDDE